MGEGPQVAWENLLRENVGAISGKGRYTCIDGSPGGRVALGTASGSLYIYEVAGAGAGAAAGGVRLLEVVPLPDVTAPVSQVRLSPTEKHVAVAAAGEVFVLTMKFPAKFAPTKHTHTPTEVFFCTY